MFLCLWQVPWPYVALAARTGVDPERGDEQHTLGTGGCSAQSGLNHVETLRQIVDDQMTGDRFGMVLFAGFAGVALLLAALGIYGVMSFAVAQRTHEIGLRMALGAQKSEVVGLIVRGGIRMALPGMAIGLAGVFVLGRLMRSTLVWSGLGGLCEHGAGGGGAVRGGAVGVLGSGTAFGAGGSDDRVAERVGQESGERLAKDERDDEIKTSEMRAETSKRRVRNWRVSEHAG